MAGPTWTNIGRVARSAEIMAFAGFSGGYVVAANDFESGATAYFSADGVTWQANRLSETVDDCSGGRTFEAFVHHAASSPSQVLLVGSVRSYSPENCAGNEGVGGGAVGWVSSDGIAWQRTPVFGARHDTPSSAWAVPGGWGVGLDNCCDFDTIWQSTGGSAWQTILQIEGTQDGGYSIHGGAAADGTRVVAAATGQGWAVLRSSDGASWDPLPVGDGSTWPQAVLPPLPGRSSSWLVASADDAEHTMITLSSDTDQWQESQLPGRRTLTAAAATSSGFVGSAEYPCDIAVFYGLARHVSGCDQSRQRQYVSVDGVTWTSISPRLEGPVELADGPAGVLLVGADSGRVWLLRP